MSNLSKEPTKKSRNYHRRPQTLDLRPRSRPLLTRRRESDLVEQYLSNPLRNSVSSPRPDNSVDFESVFGDNLRLGDSDGVTDHKPPSYPNLESHFSSQSQLDRPPYLTFKHPPGIIDPNQSSFTKPTSVEDRPFVPTVISAKPVLGAAAPLADYSPLRSSSSESEKSEHSHGEERYFADTGPLAQISLKFKLYSTDPQTEGGANFTLYKDGSHSSSKY